VIKRDLGVTAFFWIFCVFVMFVDLWIVGPCRHQP